MLLIRSFILLWLFAAPLAHLCAQVAGQPVYMYPLSLNEAGKPLDWAALRSEGADSKSQSSLPWVVYWVGHGQAGFSLMEPFFVADIDAAGKRLHLVRYDEQAIATSGSKTKPLFTTTAIDVGWWDASQVLVSYNAMHRDQQVLLGAVCTTCRPTGGEFQPLVCYRASTGQEMATSIEPTDFMYAFAEQHGRYLIATSARISSPRWEKASVLGWVDIPQLVVWDNRLGIIPADNQRSLTIYATAEAARTRQATEVLWKSPPGYFADADADRLLFLASVDAEIMKVYTPQHKVGYLRRDQSVAYQVFMTGKQLDLIHSKFSSIDCFTCSASERRRLVDQLMKDLCGLVIGKAGGDVCCDYTTIDLLAGLFNITKSNIRQCISIKQPFFDENICDFANAKITTDIEINEISSYFAKSFAMISNVKNQYKIYSFPRNRETYWWVPLEALFPDTN